MQVESPDPPVFIDTGGREFSPSLPTLVFIHGAQHDHFVWKTCVNRFAGTTCNLFAPDLPGHGRSGGAPLPSIEAMADWLANQLAKVSPRETASLILVGHSMGSLVALETAQRLPERMRHLVLVGTAIPMPVAPALLDAARDDPPRAMALINRWSHAPLAWRGGQRGGPPLWLPALNLRIMERQPAATLFNDLSACNAYGAGEAALSRITCPVTLVAGSADRMTPIKSARKLAAKHPGTSLIEIHGAGHALMAESPESLFACLQALLP